MPVPYTELGPARFLRVTTAERIALTHASGLVVYDTEIGNAFISDGAQWTQYITKLQLPDMFDAVVDAGYQGTLDMVYPTLAAAIAAGHVSIFIRSMGDYVDLDGNGHITIEESDNVQRIQGKDADTTLLGDGSLGPAAINVTVNKQNVTVEQLALDPAVLTFSTAARYPTAEDLLVTGDGQLVLGANYGSIKTCRFQDTNSAGLVLSETSNGIWYAGIEIVAGRFGGSWIDMRGPSGGVGYESLHDVKLSNPYFLQGDADYFIDAAATGRVNDVKIIGGSVYAEKDNTTLIRLTGKGHLIQGVKFQFGPGIITGAEGVTAITLDDNDAPTYNPSSITIIGCEITSLFDVTNDPWFFRYIGAGTPRRIVLAFNYITTVLSYVGTGRPRFKGAENMEWIGNELAGCTIDFDSKANQVVIGGDMTGCTLQNIPTDIIFRNVKGQADRGNFSFGTFVANLLAGTDDTYDIGATGATRFRDLWLSRHATIAQKDRTHTVGPTLLDLAAATHTLDFVNTIMRGVNVQPTVVYKQAGAVLGQVLPYNTGLTVKNEVSVSVDPGPYIGYNDGTIHQVDTATGRTLSAYRSFQANPTINRINSGTMTVTELTGLIILATVGAGITCTTRRGIWIFNATNSGTITTQIGIDIAALSGATTNIGLRNAATTVWTPSGAQTLAAGTAILANATVVQINSSSGAVTITAAPTIADGQDGQELIIINTDSTDAITLQDQGTLASSNLRLSTATYAIGPRDSLRLIYSATIGDWIEVGRTNVI